jgi:hypothetical protein
MTKAQHAALIDHNQRRYAVDRAPPRPDANGPEPARPDVAAADVTEHSAAAEIPAATADDWRS